MTICPGCSTRPSRSAPRHCGYLGLRHDQVVRDGQSAGLQVVADRCLKIEHARFAGGLHLAGFNTGVIDSRRP